MRIAKFALCLLLFSASCLAQYQCTVGSGVSSQAANTGQNCAPFSTPTGQEIVALNQTASVTTQVICPADATCPAGLYVLDLYIEPNALGTLISAVSAQVSYTSDVRTFTNMNVGSSLSLIQTQPISGVYVFYKTANTAVTVQTTAVNLTGSPSYNFRARINLIGNN